MFFAQFLIGKAYSNGVSKNMAAYSKSASYAEQALNSIKVVFAFG